MPQLIRLGVAVLAVAGFFTAAPRASADVLYLKLEDGGNAVTYKPYGGNQVSINAGPFHWSQNQPINANYPNPLTTYCIDLDHSISKGSSYQYYTESNLTLAPSIGNDASKVAAINELFDRDYKNSLTSSANEAAFQLALWKLVYDGASNTSLHSGRIEADTSTGDGKDAQALLNSLGTPYQNHDLNGYHLEAVLSKSENQNQITVVPTGAVPAPPAIMLAGIGVLALFGRTRWTRRATA